MIVYGFGIKIYSIVLGALAFPTYLGLYVLEIFMPFKLFSLNIPRKNPAKTIMNLCSALITICILSGIGNFSAILDIKNLSNEVDKVNFALSVFSGNFYSDFMTIVFLISIITIYLISNIWSKKDSNDYWTKIENLSIPSLWRNIIDL
jgi:hypothetical protein